MPAEDSRQAELTRASLLHRLREGADERSWWEFDRQYRDLILRYCRRRGLQAADAEDVRQLVMIQLARSFSTFDYDQTKGRFRSYLRTAVENSVRNHFRRPRREHEPLSIDVEAPAEAELEHLWEHEWKLHHYRLAMTEIRTSFAEASLTMFDELLAGKSVAEIAESHATTTQAVHKVKQRIRDRLSELISSQVREEEGLDG